MITFLTFAMAFQVLCAAGLVLSLIMMTMGYLVRAVRFYQTNRGNGE